MRAKLVKRIPRKPKRMIRSAGFALAVVITVFHMAAHPQSRVAALADRLDALAAERRPWWRRLVG